MQYHVKHASTIFVRGKPMNLEIWDALCDQVDSAGSQAGGRRSLKKWIEKNIAHPTQDGRPWSWVGHEYQIGIVEDLHPTIATVKPAQTGVSELGVAISLGLLGVFPNINVIYALQSKTYAQTFATSRVSPAISKSKKLKALLNREVDSTSLKQIGSSFLHLTGTVSESGAISVPASALVIDEYEFGNPKVIGTLASRLEHHKEEDKIVFAFSTPLYSNTGISQFFQQGNQNYYMVKHEKCEKWVKVDPTSCYVIPGHNNTLDKIEVKDVASGKLDADGAWIRCPHCLEEITRSNMADPSRRAWVPTFLEKTNKIGIPHTYQVYPHDVMKIKSLGQIIRSITLYKSVEKWHQYGLGIPYDGGGGQILESVARASFTGEHFSPENGKLLNGCVLGLDVGKTSHLVIANRVDGKMVVRRMETIRQGFEGELQTTVVDRYKQFRCLRGVSDAAPDFTAVRAIQEHLPDDGLYGGYFVRSLSGVMEPYKVKDSEGMVAIARTRAFDAFVDLFNKGNVILPNVAFKEEVVSHLLAVKRITDERAAGEDASKWVKLTDADHWVFSLLYCFIALEILDANASRLWLPSSMIGIGRVPLRG